MGFIKIPVKGMNDYLPDEMSIREYVIGEIKNTYSTFGFNIIETPCMEHIENLCSKQGGENEKLIFKVLKRGEKLDLAHAKDENDLVDIGLRYDLTVPLSRYYANNMSKLSSPFKALQIGNVWRADRPQKGRFRQFIQCDIDILGEKINLAENELVLATTTLLNKIGFTNFKVRINDRRILKTLVEYCQFPDTDVDKILIILDKIDKIGKKGVFEELTAAGYNQEAVDKYLTFFSEDIITQSAKEYFAKIGVSCVDETVINNLDEIMDTVKAVSGVKFQVLFDPTLVRGMSYYTGPIFEIQMEELASSVAGGGRYDNMVEKYAGISVPACGFSIGFERIIAILKEKNYQLPIDSKQKIAYVIDKQISKEKLIEIFKEVTDLRNKKNKIVLVVYKNKNFKFQKERLLADGFSEIILK